MEIIKNYCSLVSIFLMIVAMVLVASATDELGSSSAAKFHPDYPVGRPPIQGGTGYVTKTDSNGWHTSINYGEKCLDPECTKARVHGLLHAGEDWNYKVGNAELTAESGKPARVYSIAGGKIVAIFDKLVIKSNYGSGIVIEHTLPSGEKKYSVYEHIDITSGLKKGDFVGQGDPIGTIRDISSSGLSPHLHFEIRNKWEDGQKLYPNAKTMGYYSSIDDLEADGLIDPSDFIDSHRSTQSSGSSIVGKWIGHLDGESVLSDGTTKPFSADYITTYNSDGTYIEEAIRYNSDGTYSFVGLPDYIYTGKWIQNGNTIREMGDVNSIGQGGGSTESTLTGNTISGIDTYSYGGSSTTKRWTQTRAELSEPSG